MNDTPTKAIRNTEESADLKSLTLNKIFGRQTV